ncbi:MAG: hypothetical protein LBP86_11025, partial [Azoarcus sp.]|nr:hypothetical protein [Azoarcus sp.]
MFSTRLPERRNPLFPDSFPEERHGLIPRNRDRFRFPWRGTALRMLKRTKEEKPWEKGKATEPASRGNGLEWLEKGDR